MEVKRVFVITPYIPLLVDKCKSIVLNMFKYPVLLECSEDIVSEFFKIDNKVKEKLRNEDKEILEAIETAFALLYNNIIVLENVTTEQAIKIYLKLLEKLK